MCAYYIYIRKDKSGVERGGGSTHLQSSVLGAGGNEGANCRDQDSVFRCIYVSLCAYNNDNNDMMCMIYYFTGFAPTAAVERVQFRLFRVAAAVTLRYGVCTYVYN